MSREQLEDALERLRGELDALDRSEGAANDRLRALIDEVEGQLDALAEGGDESSLVENVRSHIEQFEVEHPRVTNILNDIMVTLSNMGI